METALAVAAKNKKKILWYVPTLTNSPMDRKPEIDLFVRAGFFSDPDILELLKDFILLKRVPSRSLARKYDLQPFKFIEPGFLVLDAEGLVLDRLHAVSTFHSRWFRKRLLGAEALDQEARDSLMKMNTDGKPKLAVQQALVWLGRGKVAEAARTLARFPRDPRARFLAGAVLFKQGRHAAARKAWRALATAKPTLAIAWRAQAEAEGFGPISRGFWIFRDLPEGVRYDLPGTTQARPEKDLPMLRKRSVEYLLSMQGENGGWEDSNYDFGGLDSLPNVYVAVSAMACQALLVHRSLDPKRIDSALEKGLGYVLDKKNLNPRDRDEWLWARVYPMHLLAQLLGEKRELAGFGKRRLKKEMREMLRELFKRQGRDGSFRHEYYNPFATASTLLALRAAKDQGFDVPIDAIERALRSVEICRTKLGAFSYLQVRRGGRAQATVKGSACRMPLCEGALYAWERSSEAKLEKALSVAFQEHELLEASRKYDDHAGPHGIGGFFYWYDQHARSLVLPLLGAKGNKWRKKQREQILKIPEIDGTFIDSHELGHVYGTASALLCLGKPGAGAGAKAQTGRK